MKIYSQPHRGHTISPHRDKNLNAYWGNALCSLPYTRHINTSWNRAELPDVRASDAMFNRLTPNDPYMGRTARLTSKRCILYIYSTTIGTEYFKHALYSPFFFSSKCSMFHNANLFGSCIIHILYTGMLKLKRNSGAKGLIVTTGL